MSEPRKGRQTPTQSVVLPYYKTFGQEAIDLYNSTGRTAQEWQELLISDILASNDDGLWVHTKFGYSVPRRNGKNEIVAIREFWGIINGEDILHTAHRTATSSAASKRLSELLDKAGWREIKRMKKDEVYEQCYTYSRQFGMEKITILDEGGGTCDFRTRSSKGGLGEGFDLLVIDEAQEYTDDQESALKYVISSSKNPQTIFCGTPPTPLSSGTVFTKLREKILSGSSFNSGWAEWSVPLLSDVKDKELWYECNPSLGTIFTERIIMDEIGSDEIDFNIQRLGLWIKYSLKSAISRAEWEELQVKKLPDLRGQMHIGIKYGKDGKNVAVGIAVKTKDDKIFVEAIDCREIRAGNQWIVDFILKSKASSIVVDGSSGQQLLVDDLKEWRVQKPTLPTVAEIIAANANFESGVFQGNIVHMGQPSLTQAISNCEHRAMGSNGGFGYRSLKEGIEVSLIDSVMLAYWLCSKSKEKRIQRISY